MRVMSCRRGRASGCYWRRGEISASVGASHELWLPPSFGSGSGSSFCFGRISLSSHEMPRIAGVEGFQLFFVLANNAVRDATVIRTSVIMVAASKLPSRAAPQLSTGTAVRVSVHGSSVPGIRKWKTRRLAPGLDVRCGSWAGSLRAEAPA
jgi:hypothetical protein